MNHEPPSPDAGAQSPLALPRHTTPTWEVELLISGVAVFAMLQLPGMFDDALFSLRPRVDAAWHQPLGMIHMYLKSAAVLLAATFAIHLLLRANWIALVGMHSIYPDGVRWSQLRIGPVQRAFEQARTGDPSQAIDRADNRATTVFATGVALSTILLSLTLFIGLLFVVAVGLLAALGIAMDPADLFLACVLFTVVPTTVATMLDRRYGDRLSSEGLPRRALEGVFRCFGVFGLTRGGNVVGLLSSHSGERRTTMLVMAVFMPVMLGVMIGARAMETPERLGGYGAFPSPEATRGRGLEDAHYDLPVPGSVHFYKYRLAYVAAGQCVLRYDNEAGKGDHKHIGDTEVAYTFTALDQLIEDFWADVAQL